MQYQLRFYDGRHHLSSRFDFIAPDDGEAEAAAELMGGVLAMELWSGDRRLLSWAPDPVSAQASRHRTFWRRNRH